ncbi:MAG: hypothetical protein B6245_20165 [Desulfobacteraceae bacterium 4572_88]|nr:MAG: hypothetical protein B6245_20165 [Desulfobacteraceae bacterium 4572_88]RLC01523.1 MAG: hypothetical protein DRI57_30995 [Deltaproteobacteria bacterium]
MNNKKNAVLLILFFTAFGLGLTQLFTLRFEAGDIYPPYSSLRSDPLGSRAFYEGLQELESLSLQRNFGPLSKIRSEGDFTLFYLGAYPYEPNFRQKDALRVFERLAAHGGRLVFSFFPAKERKTEKKDKGTVKAAPLFPLSRYWGISPVYSESAYGKSGKIASIANESLKEKLPDTIPWRTSLWFDFDGTSGPWKTLYTCEGRPVVIEKPFGRGQIILSADSYFLSNEALRMERRPKLLAWLVGKNTHVIFDESHMGIQKTQGIADLARKYRLHGLFWGTLLLAGLFVWKNSVRFMPPHEADDPEDATAPDSEKDSTRGLVSLLRRNIPQKEILKTCVAEWEKTLASEKKFPEDVLAEIRAAANDADPVSGYQRICRILSERKNPPRPPFTKGGREDNS